MSVKFGRLRAGNTPPVGGGGGTISYIAGSGQMGTSINEGTIADIPYVGVGANRLALLFGAISFETQAFDAPIDPGGATWNFLGDLAGGDPTHTAPIDRLHMSRIGAWWRILAGTESGNVQLTSTPVPNSITSVMEVYQSSTGAWVTPVMVSGTQNTHGAGRSMTTGSLATQANDQLAAAFATDTEQTTLITAPTFTQAGATLGTPTWRSRSLTTTGNNGACTTTDIDVVTGATAAIVAGYSGGANQCGPGMVVRLRAA